MNLKELLERSGKSCTEVGFRCLITEQTVRNWIRGKYLPRLDIITLKTLLDTLECSFEELYTAVHTTKLEAERVKAEKAMELESNAAHEEELEEEEADEEVEQILNSYS